jgi:hypothetical protein
VFCGKCGKPVTDKAKFCDGCGSELVVPAPAASETRAESSSKAPLFILLVFAIVMAFLGYGMMEFKRAGKKLRGVDVSLTPARLTVKPRQSRVFEASVVGSENGDVTWSVAEGAEGGTVVPAGASAHDGRVFSAGRYTAPEKPGVYHVIVTSKADETRASSATITVNP